MVVLYYQMQPLQVKSQQLVFEVGGGTWGRTVASLFEVFNMNSDLTDILILAYEPCGGLDSRCKGLMQWNPSNGHIPRGFCGARGITSNIELVLVMAEPGNPDDSENYPLGTLWK